MTVNKPNREFIVKIGPRGVGRTQVPYPPGKIEMLRVLDAHGVPHALHTLNENSAWIEVLGAMPDTDVVVVFYTED